ncbi:MAG: thioredoxin-dependent thiol peroxidase [Bacteroidia bacterium]|nr:thioredoxin-dependent thiol peroxidase [Bacteroidia bacterium]
MLEVGTPAPAFSAQDQDGKTHTLAQYRGKKIALYFYPKDDTPGCTKEACNLRDNYAALQAAGYVVLGVSTDDTTSHAKFATKFSLPFPLLADPDQQLVTAYQVWVEKNMYGKKYMGTARVTYLIDEAGTIARVIDKVKTEDHAAQILA